jgi:hypothetical protein
MNNIIKCKTIYSTEDGAQFDDVESAQRHAATVNILKNCLPSEKLEAHYKTIFLLLKDFKIVEMDQEDRERRNNCTYLID